MGWHVRSRLGASRLHDTNMRTIQAHINRKRTPGSIFYRLYSIQNVTLHRKDPPIQHLVLFSKSSDIHLAHF